MPYNLIVTRPDGTSYKTLRSPYGQRADTIRTVRMIVEERTGVDERALTFAERVSKYPLGETVTHSVLKIGFRTEEAPSASA